jgi:hypothetical protein
MLAIRDTERVLLRRLPADVHARQWRSSSVRPHMPMQSSSVIMCI